SSSFVLKGARVVTMKGDAVLDNADVVVTGNRIAGVGPSGSVSVPAGARTFDAQGKTVIPGLIDTHAHMHYSSFEIFPDTKWEYAANLAYGVTTTYDPSAPSLDVFAQAEMVEAGLLLGPRIYSSGDVLYGGQQTDIWAQVENQKDALRQVRRMKAYGARMIKASQQPRRSQRMYFAEACRQQHMLLTAEGAGELQTDLSMVLDGYTAWEHALPVDLGRDVVDFVAKSGTCYTPTLLLASGGPRGRAVLLADAEPARRSEAESLRAARVHRREGQAPSVDLAVGVPLPGRRDGRSRRRAGRRQRVSGRPRAAAGPGPSLGDLVDGRG